jgi:hypothetical protein
VGKEAGEDEEKVRTTRTGIHCELETKVFANLIEKLLQNTGFNSKHFVHLPLFRRVRTRSTVK